MPHLKFMNEEKSIILKNNGSSYVVIEPHMSEWFPALAENPDDYVPPPTVDPLVAWRATLQCTPAQMRLTLHRAGLLATVQAIADSDPEAKILWEYATQIIRNSPFIDALGSASFTPTQIDDLFVAAMSA